MRKISFIAVALVLTIALLSCGAKSTDPAGTTTSGATKAVIKNNGTTIAHLVSWTDFGGYAAVYIPSVDRYATIDLETGNYITRGIDSAVHLFYSADACAGTPVVTSEEFVGEVGKAIIYYASNYYRITAKRASYAYKSSLNSSDDFCNETDGTTVWNSYTGVFDIVTATQPYNFAAIAPLTVTYE